MRLAGSVNLQDPVTLVLLGLVVGLGVVLVLGATREGLANPNNVDPDQVKEDQDFINNWCGPKGKSFESLKEEKPYFFNDTKRYREGDVKWQCQEARNKFVVDAREGKGKGASVDCGSRKECPDAGLRRRKPCMNKDETKCCEFKDGDVSKCVDFKWQSDSVMDSQKWDSSTCLRGECPDRSLRANYQCLHVGGKHCCTPWKRDGEKQKCVPLSGGKQQPVSTDRVDGITDTGSELRGCGFSGTVRNSSSKTGWSCPGSHPFMTGLNGAGGSHTQRWGSDRQCAKTRDCATRALDFAKGHATYGVTVVDRSKNPLPNPNDD